jgi:hypothetical protein
MKKTLLVILCLSIATLAQGAIGFVPSKTNVTTGETITIRLISDSPCMGFSIDAVSDGDKGGLCSNLSFNSGLTILNPGYIENAHVDYWSDFGPYVLFDYAAACATTSAIPAGATIFSFDYKADSILGAVTIAPIISEPWWPIIMGASGSIYPPPGDPQGITGCTITVVPEPMTVALLGFGGLLLRRRRG